MQKAKQKLRANLWGGATRDCGWDLLEQIIIIKLQDCISATIIGRHVASLGFLYDFRSWCPRTGMCTLPSGGYNHESMIVSSLVVSAKGPTSPRQKTVHRVHSCVPLLYREYSLTSAAVPCHRCWTPPWAGSKHSLTVMNTCSRSLTDEDVQGVFKSIILLL